MLMNGQLKRTIWSENKSTENRWVKNIHFPLDISYHVDRNVYDPHTRNETTRLEDKLIRVNNYTLVYNNSATTTTTYTTSYESCINQCRRIINWVNWKMIFFFCFLRSFVCYSCDKKSLWTRLMRYMNYRPGWWALYFFYCSIPVSIYVWYLCRRCNEVYNCQNCNTRPWPSYARSVVLIFYEWLSIAINSKSINFNSLTTSHFVYSIVVVC